MDDPAAWEERAGGHLGPGQRARIARPNPVEEQSKDDHEADAGRQLERDRDHDHDPPWVDRADWAQHGRSAGTESSSESPSTPRSPAVARRVPIRGRGLD
jgi:hypothetical protein